MVGFTSNPFRKGETMSAFLVSHETINAVCFGWRPEGDNSPGCEQLDWLGNRLWAMNREALKQRYGDEFDAPEVFSFRPHQYTRIQCLKAAQCLRYQCSEGDVPKLALYDELSRVCERLAYEVINKMPEYGAVAWDLANPANYQPKLAEPASA